MLRFLVNMTHRQTGNKKIMQRCGPWTRRKIKKKKKYSSRAVEGKSCPIFSEWASSLLGFWFWVTQWCSFFPPRGLRAVVLLSHLKCGVLPPSDSSKQASDPVSPRSKQWVWIFHYISLKQFTVRPQLLKGKWKP